MRAKLGLLNEEEEDKELIGDLLDLMEQHHADYTNTFRALTLDTVEGMDLFQSSEFGAWHKRWKARLGRQQERGSFLEGADAKQQPGRHSKESPGGGGAGSRNGG